MCKCCICSLISAWQNWSHKSHASISTWKEMVLYKCACTQFNLPERKKRTCCYGVTFLRTVNHVGLLNTSSCFPEIRLAMYHGRVFNKGLYWTFIFFYFFCEFLIFDASGARARNWIMRGWIIKKYMYFMDKQVPHPPQHTSFTSPWIESNKPEIVKHLGIQKIRRWISVSCFSWLK